MTPATIEVDAAPCRRCGDKPDASVDDGGFNVYHLCGDRMTLVANCKTPGEAVATWNKMQEPKPCQPD